MRTCTPQSASSATLTVEVLPSYHILLLIARLVSGSDTVAILAPSWPPRSESGAIARAKAWRWNARHWFLVAPVPEGRITVTSVSARFFFARGGVIATVVAEDIV